MSRGGRWVRDPYAIPITSSVAMVVREQDAVGPQVGARDDRHESGRHEAGTPGVREAPRPPQAVAPLYDPDSGPGCAFDGLLWAWCVLAMLGVLGVLCWGLYNGFPK